MRKFAVLAAILAVALPVSAAAQNGQRQIIRVDADALVALQIIDPVMGHGIATFFFSQPRALDGHQGVHFQSRYVVANCDARTIRLGPDTYFSGDGAEIGERALSNTAFAAVQAGSLEADLLDVECLNKRAGGTLPPLPDTVVLEAFLASDWTRRPPG